MPVIFDSADRKAISRRVVKIPAEQAAFLQAQNNATAAAIEYGAVDHGNAQYYNFYQGIVSSYETEKQNINGFRSSSFDETDINNSASKASGNLFFPTVPPATTAEVNKFLNPKIIPQVNGNASTATATDYSSEVYLLNNVASTTTPSGNGINQIANIIRTGFSDAGGSTTLSAGYTIGDTTINLTASIGVVPGNRIIVQNGSNSFIAVVTAVLSLGLNLNIYPITLPSANIVTGSVSCVFAGFTQPQRQTLIATTTAHQDILDELSTSGLNSLSTLVNNWITALNNEATAITNNGEPRTTEASNNTAAGAAVATTLSNIATWVGLPDTGVGGKFDNGSITSLLGHVTSRTAQFASRISQIDAALGSVVDNGNGTFTFGITEEDIYYQRYRLLNARINRAYGSLTRSVRLSSSNSILGELIANDTFMAETYHVAPDVTSNRMIATKFTKDSDGTNLIEVESISDFATGDVVYIISESQSEITASISFVAQNIITLNINVPLGYNKSELARIYKVTAVP